MNELTNVWMYKWMHEQTIAQKNEQTNKRMNELKIGWMEGHMDTQTNGWMSEWTMKTHISLILFHTSLSSWGAATTCFNLNWTYTLYEKYEIQIHLKMN